MSLTEVVFEVADSQYPICHFTREHPGSRAVYRILDTGTGSGVFRAALTLLGPSEIVNSLVKELKATKRYDEFEVVNANAHAVMVKLGHRVPEARASAGTGVQPVERFLSAFGQDAIIEPIVADAGKLRVRGLVPQPLDTKRVLVKLQEMQRALAWEHFRVIRVAEFKAREYADILRRILTPEQEDLLRLALTLGYYDTPKRCKLGDIAARLGLSVSPIHKKLKEIEQALIGAHIDPSVAKRPDPKRSARLTLHADSLDSPGTMTEVAIRIRWATYAPLAFTARHAGARVIFHNLLEEGAESNALLVTVSPERDYRELIHELERVPIVRRADVTSKDADHVSLRLRTTIPSDGDWVAHPNPFSHLAQRFGRDAILKPVVMEAGDMWVRMIIARAVADGEVLERVGEAAKAAQWDDYEIVSVRRVEVDPALAPLPTPERMTPRQEEVLKIAHALGYYKTPRECTLEDVARTLGISANAIHKNLTAAEQKIICNYLSAGA